MLNFPDVQAVEGTVSVDNLPAVQTVGGTVNVGNLPTVQTVGGSVAVSNLPLDAGGALRVTAGCGPRPLVLRSTTNAFQGNLGGRTGATAKCQAEFPGSHFVRRAELVAALNSDRGVKRDQLLVD